MKSPFLRIHIPSSEIQYIPGMPPWLDLDIQKISTHVVEVLSKLIKDITNILHHNGLLIMTINEICVIQNNLITSGQT